jgi:LIVCS family branched-chain amino acid:cation transporter
MKIQQIFSIGVALFAMFFGAGNVVFPLDLGRTLGDNVWPAVFGLFLSGVLMPVIGVFAGVLFEGDYRAFFARIGAIPGELLTLVCMLTIGPIGATPRTLTLSHSGFAWYFPGLPLWLFTIIAGVIILALTLHKGRVLAIIGKFLAPIKIILLSLIIFAGFFATPMVPHTNFSSSESFWMGLFEGYGTLDLLVAIFLAKIIFAGLDKSLFDNRRKLLFDLFKAGCVGAFLLGIIYAGFMLTSSYHGLSVAAVSRDQLIFALGDFLLGRFGILASITVAVACMTTAIALTAVFADYVSTDLFKGKVSYKVAVIGSVFVVCCIANLGFEGIMKHFIVPVAFMCYPALIMLAVLNIAYKLFNFKPVKIPVFLTFVITVARYFALI